MSTKEKILYFKVARHHQVVITSRRTVGRITAAAEVVSNPGPVDSATSMMSERVHEHHRILVISKRRSTRAERESFVRYGVRKKLLQKSERRK